MKNICSTASALALAALMAAHSTAQSNYEPYTFTTLAGGGGFASPRLLESSARLNIPTSARLDKAGNLIVTDTFNHVIRKVTPAGEITTLAGLPGVSGSADGTGSAARFYLPYALALDGAGNVYVAGDSLTIRKVTPEGVVTTIAGRANTVGSADGLGGAARFNLLGGAAMDSAGNLYVSDAGNNTIRKLMPTGADWLVTTIAGLAGSAGAANGTNRAARFNFPQGLDIDASDNLYVADTDNFTVRKVSPEGTNWVVTTLAGRAGNSGSVDGTNSAARFNGFAGLAVDSAGNIFVADTDNHTLRKVTAAGTNWVVTTLAGLAANPGSADGTGTAARFNFPYGLAVGSTGVVYVADTFNFLIRKMTLAETNWVVGTMAGLGGNFGGTDGPGNAALFKGPSSVAVDRLGNTYVADQINHTIRKLTPEGDVTTLAGLAGYGGSQNSSGSGARFNNPRGLAADGAGNVYVADSGNAVIRKVAPDGLVTTLAGLAGNSGSSDGSGSSARFVSPGGLALDSTINIYVADTENHTIRRVTSAGAVSTRAGSPGVSGSADGIGPAARFNNPTGVAVDAATNVYVADTQNHTIRKMTPARAVTTLAGSPGIAGSADGLGSAARFYYPSGIAVDRAGSLYVADTYNNTLRKLTPAGTEWVVSTLGGMPGILGTGDGRGAAARFANPGGIAVDGAGSLYIADFYFNAIRKGFAPPRILNAGFAAGQFGFELAAPPGSPVTVEASSDLLIWRPIWTDSAAAGPAFSDPGTAAHSHRFYRAVQP